ncbi:hypothetical protein CAC42_2044 [Sphaceloma murrayae]|uniref:EthD domain-containing protein n=1 Tax=Sphaceloma murrayae TaxID=2082308 RepID=A0A2K1QI23_9PEZI|nr:hypothetical protein CAC42_2044 [Sphaceloma murrayae]
MAESIASPGHSSPVTQSQLIKVIQSGRRKPDLTQSEYFDYRWQTHGKLSAAKIPGSPRPHAYTQTHLTQSSFPPRNPSGPPPNALAAWTGRDDVTELYFSNETALLATFNSEYVRTVVGPDVLNFGDLETSFSIVAREKTIPVPSLPGTKPKSAHGDKDNVKGSWRALLFLATPNGTREGALLEAELTPLLASALSDTSADTTGLTANVGVTVPGFDQTAYFGGYAYHALVYKIGMAGRGSFGTVRAAQKRFFVEAGSRIDQLRSFALFGEEGIVFDEGMRLEFDPGRQPRLGLV